jgi:dihydroorotase-like cyclic amidohydrolase
MTTLVRNDRVVTATDDYVGDVFVDGETIKTTQADASVEAIDAGLKVATGDYVGTK